MESAQRLFPVLVINRERIHPGEYDAGTIRIASESAYSLRILDTVAEWENDDRMFPFRDVTLVQFGGEYEQTLALVARGVKMRSEPSIERMCLSGIRPLSPAAHVER